MKGMKEKWALKATEGCTTPLREHAVLLPSLRSGEGAGVRCRGVTCYARFRLLTLTLLLLLIPLPMTDAQSTLSLDAPIALRVGEALTITAHAQAKTALTIALYNGVQRLSASLTTDDEGAAAWSIPAGTVISAGTSVISAHVGKDTVRKLLHVFPGAVAQLDFLTTANNLTAYGDQKAMLIALVGDQYGNALSTRPLTVDAQFPDAPPRQITMSAVNGLGWTWISSAGSPGRMRLSLSVANLTQMLELAQIPGAPAQIELSTTPTCVRDDGRDVITLQASVKDAHGSPVADSTLVQFQWDWGFGSAEVFDGVASLRVPAPSSAGVYTFRAISGRATSAPVLLTVQADGCS